MCINDILDLCTVLVSIAEMLLAQWTEINPYINSTLFLCVNPYGCDTVQYGGQFFKKLICSVEHHYV